MFPAEHELSLRTEGLDRPRRKRGRPAKQIVPIETETDSVKNNEKNKLLEDVEDDIEGPDGRRRRKIRPPAKFAELVQVNRILVI